jgi:Xaa-Pro aminopeptidase
MESVPEEVTCKLEVMRHTLQETGAAGIRLRGTDWFAWATAGGSNAVLLAAETGVAEVLVTPEAAWVLTDEIEAQRLKDEEIPQAQNLSSLYQLSAHPWANSDDRQSLVRDATGGGKVLSDRPTQAESALPASLVNRKRVMMPTELERYRQVGRLASEAMTEVLAWAEPTWTEAQLAGAGAEALWARGLHPALTLAAGERRLPLYRHPVPKQEAIGQQAMLVFCARGYGLYANLTRFVHFGQLSSSIVELHRQVAEIEAIGLNSSRPGQSLSQVYEALAQAYQQHGYPQAIREHHQGGTTGYLAREVVATPNSSESLAANMAVAWNPSLVGAKLEDTFVLHQDGSLENLTFDPNWLNVMEIAGRSRSLPLERER